MGILGLDSRPDETEIPGPGAILRQIRKDKGATLKDFSELTGFPVSTLSKLETGRLGMNYDKILRLSRSLGVDFAQLVSSHNRLVRDSTSLPTLGRREITRAGDGPAIKTAVYDYRYPASDLVHKALNPMFIDVTARSVDDFDDFMRHPGDEFMVVLEGAIDFYSDLYKPVRLNLGDSVYFDGNMGHAYVAAAEGRCRVLSVCSATDDELREAQLSLEPGENQESARVQSAV